MRWLLTLLAAWAIRLLRFTWRVRLLGPDLDHSRPLVVCFWHGHQAGMFAHPRPKPVVVLSSLSRDGELQSRILGRLGFWVVRGSSSRGGAAGLKALVARMSEGADAVFAVDGPRGPLHKVKPGAVLAAQKSGADLVPVSVSASRAWVFEKSWDRYTLPKPFAEVRIVRGAPLSVAGKTVDALSNELEQTMLSLEAR